MDVGLDKGGLRAADDTDRRLLVLHKASGEAAAVVKGNVTVLSWVVRPPNCQVWGVWGWRRGGTQTRGVTRPPGTAVAERAARIAGVKRSGWRAIQLQSAEE